MSIGQRIKNARMAMNMTQEELGSAVGVTGAAIGNYETEVSSPKVSVLIPLMDVLHVDANYIYQDYIHHEETLSDDEFNLIRLYRNAETTAKEIVVETLANHQKKESEQSAI